MEEMTGDYNSSQKQAFCWQEKVLTARHWYIQKERESSKRRKSDWHGKSGCVFATSYELRRHQLRERTFIRKWFFFVFQQLLTKLFMRRIVSLALQKERCL